MKIIKVVFNNVRDVEDILECLLPSFVCIQLDYVSLLFTREVWLEFKNQIDFFTTDYKIILAETC